MTNLECVNAVLRAVGIASVGTVETSGPSDAAEAWRHLDDASRMIQAKGWSYNRRFDITLTPNGSNHLPIPANVFPDSIDSYGSSAGTNVVPYGDRLYDVRNNTDEFASDLKVQYILRFELCSIPENVQQYIVAYAALTFARYLEVRGRRVPSLGLLEREMYRRRVHALRADTAITDQSVRRDGNAAKVVARPFDGIGDYGVGGVVEL